MAVELVERNAGEPTVESMVRAVKQANRAIFEKAGSDTELHGMGTTLVAIRVVAGAGDDGDEIAWINVGDSRVYLLRDDNLIQLSHDHSLVEDLVRDGQLTPDEAAVHPQRNILTRALGIDLDVDVDTGTVLPFTGDRFLLCSDGLTGPLNPTLIGMILASLPPADAAQTLVDLANLLGGPDNITAIVAEVADPISLGQQQARPWTDVVNPLTEGLKSPRNNLLVGGLAFTAVAVLYAFTSALIAIIGAIGLAVAAIVAGWAIAQSKTKNPCPSVRGHHGRCPYRSYAAAPNAQNIEMLSDIVRQLEDLEDQRDWSFDWKDIHADRHDAHRAIAAGDFTAAVVAYSSAVRRLMQAVRASRPDLANDSGIHLG